MEANTRSCISETASYSFGAEPTALPLGALRVKNMKTDFPDVPGWAVGLAAGLAVGIGGAIKDAPYEGFSLLTFMRSPIVGALVGLAMEHALHVQDPKVLFFATIGGERIVVEGWKLLRVQKPGKFTFGEWGVPKQLVK
jgi:hypothetical protein